MQFLPQWLRCALSVKIGSAPSGSAQSLLLNSYAVVHVLSAMDRQSAMIYGWSVTIKQDRRLNKPGIFQPFTPFMYFAQTLIDWLICQTCQLPFKHKYERECSLVKIQLQSFYVHFSFSGWDSLPKRNSIYILHILTSSKIYFSS